MKVHSLEHVKFETLACIADWLKAKKLKHSSTRFYRDEPLPNIDDVDFLIVMGGPMSVNDEEHYSWLHGEKEFIKEAIEKNKKVLGVCLGAQLIASAMGEEVKESPHKEIGFFPITKTAEGGTSEIFYSIPSTVEVFQWHGDAFEVPKSAKLLASSPGCINQAFSIGNNVLALQFHLEMTLNNAKRIIKNSPNEDFIGNYIQKPSEIENSQSKFDMNNQLMFKLLDDFISL